MRSSLRGRPSRRSPILKAPRVTETVLEVPASSPSGPSPTSRPLLPVPDHLVALARQTAAALIREAQQDARRIREAARTDALEAGRNEGLAIGREEGLQDGRREAQELLRNAERRAAEIVAAREEMIGQLAVEVAAHLLGMELTLNPEAVEQVVLATLRETDDTDVEVGVAPDDYTQALRASRSWQEALGAGADIRVVVDQDLPRGSCRVRGPHGVVERNWQKEITAISDLFEEVARRGL